MEINCEHVWREVSNYLDGEIDAGLRASMEEHMRGCKHCAAVLDGTRNVVKLVGDERVLEVPVGFEKRLRQRLEAELPASAAPRNYLRWLVLATAAALLIGAFTVGGGSAFRGPRLRTAMAHPGSAVPADLMVLVAEDGKMFHAGVKCTLLHDKTRLRSIPASQALREGYTPCVHCMKQFLSAGLLAPGVEIADLDIPGYQSRP